MLSCSSVVVGHFPARLTSLANDSMSGSRSYTCGYRATMPLHVDFIVGIHYRVGPGDWHGPRTAYVRTFLPSVTVLKRFWWTRVGGEPR